MIKVENIISSMLVILLTLMINTPLILKPLKATILFLLLFIISHRIYLKKYFINKDIFTIFIITVSASILFSFNGAIKDTDNPLALSTISFIWPSLWFILISGTVNNNILIKIHKIFIYSTYFIAIYILMFILNQLSIIPTWLFLSLEISNQSGFYYDRGQMEFSLLSLASLMFLIPYFYSSVIFEKKISFVKFLFLILITLIFILSGRRGLQLAVLISFFNIFFFSLFIKRKEIKIHIKQVKKKLFLFVIGLLFIIVPYTIINEIIDYNKIFEFFVDGFDFHNQDNFSSYTRLKVFNSLIEVWQHNPLIGGGYGEHGDVIRNIKMPWSYELTYVALLVQVGTLGILMYVFSILWIVWQLIIIIKNGNEKYLQISFSVLIGMLSFLIAASTNSYLTKFDYLWVIFIPVLIINLYKFDQRRKKYEI